MNVNVKVKFGSKEYFTNFLIIKIDPYSSATSFYDILFKDQIVIFGF